MAIVGARIGEAWMRPVGHGARLRVETLMAHVADDADDFVVARVVPGDADLLADRILAGPVPPRHRLVDDDPVGDVALVGLVEEPAFEQRNAHRLEVVPGHDANVRHGLIPCRGFRLADDFIARRRAETIERQPAGAADGLDARQDREPIEQALVELRPLRRLPVARARKRDFHRDQSAPDRIPRRRRGASRSSE